MGKTKKTLGLDSMGIQKTMRLTDYLGDGIGQLPLNIMSSLVGQLTYFYTEKVGLAAGMVATMLLIAKIFDAFSDLAMGKIMDAGKSPKGKCRPWFTSCLCSDHKHPDYSNRIYRSSNPVWFPDGYPHREF